MKPGPGVSWAVRRPSVGGCGSCARSAPHCCVIAAQGTHQGQVVAGTLVLRALRFVAFRVPHSPVGPWHLSEPHGEGELAVCGARCGRRGTMRKQQKRKRARSPRASAPEVRAGAGILSSGERPLPREPSESPARWET